MDVRCDRCSTEYEFDDALVSERGTSVRCTNCGHQFKVWRAESTGSDSWTVSTADGRQFVFYSLRELQRAILGRQVQRSDQLIRGAERRVLGGIPELVTFFADAERAGGVPPARPQFPTPIGLGAPPPAATLSSENRAVSLRQIQDLDPPTVPVPAIEPEPETRRKSPSEPPRPAARSTAPTARERMVDDDDLEPPPAPPKGRGATVFVGLVAVIGLGIGAAVFAPKLLAKQAAQPAASSASNPSQAKVSELLARGERALAEGDLDGARDALVRASALDEHAPRVAVALARVAVAEGEIAWLRLKLLPESAADARALASGRLADLARRATSAAAAAKHVAPNDHDAARAEIDALRLSGAQGEAKARSAALAASSPADAYSIAAVEMGDAQPAWSAIAARLKTAAAAEATPGRARAALALALARAGDTAGAKAELERLAAAPRPYPLLVELRAALDAPRDGGAPAPSASAAGSASARPTDVAALPVMGAAPAVTAPTAAAAGPAPGAGGGDDYSEAELQKKLFGDHGGPAKAPPPSKAPPPTGPHIDTSDLPGVTPP